MTSDFTLVAHYSHRTFGLGVDSALIEFDQNTDKARVDELPLFAVLPRQAGIKSKRSEEVRP